MTHDYFRHVEYQPLRTWNQAVMYFNTVEDGGLEAGVGYAKGLGQEERIRIFHLMSDIKKRGKEVVQAELQRLMPLQGEDQ